MRMLMKVQMPTEAGNNAIKNGKLPEIVGRAMETLKVEAAYFIEEEGMRTGLFFFDMEDSSGIPPAAEPFFMELGARITFKPAMNPQEMRSGIEKVMEAG